ncbi:hypothetical protein D6779_12125 [Candidatus Parcubacteria bacterium]|nr:MAG: hypothetical protein D6779_12125 [Candidatus Parcubacteria bacterium]
MRSILSAIKYAAIIHFFKKFGRVICCLLIGVLFLVIVHALFDDIITYIQSFPKTDEARTYTGLALGLKWLSYIMIGFITFFLLRKHWPSHDSTNNSKSTYSLDIKKLKNHNTNPQTTLPEKENRLDKFRYKNKKTLKGRI